MNYHCLCTLFTPLLVLQMCTTFLALLHCQLSLWDDRPSALQVQCHSVSTTFKLGLPSLHVRSSCSHINFKHSGLCLPADYRSFFTPCQKETSAGMGPQKAHLGPWQACPGMCATERRSGDSWHQCVVKQSTAE